MMKWFDILGKIQFWGWNICAVFLFTYLVGFLVLPWAFLAVFSGEMPVSIFLCVLLLVVLPFVSFWVGITRPHIVVPYFFGVQLPLMALALLRMVVMRDLSWGGALLVYTALLGGVVFTWHLYKTTPDPDDETQTVEPALSLNDPSKTAFRPVNVIGMTAVLITGIFVAALSLLYAVPAIIGTLKVFFSFAWIEALVYAPIVLPFMLVFFFSGVAFFFFPFYVAYFYPRSWWRARSGNLKTYLGVTVALVTVWLGAHHLTARSNEAPFVAEYGVMDDDAKKTVWENPEKYRAQLLRAYLHEYRYLGTTERRNSLIQLYDDALWDGTFLGPLAQGTQNYLLSPMTYRGRRSDKKSAGQIYSEIFDTPIQRAERKHIQKAIEATYNRDEVSAGLMNVGIRNVAIEDQTIRTDDQGDYAIIEIEERYRNLTQRPQEIFYYFSLPEDAVMTGVWIGQTRDREKMDAFIVAPRGAAQKVYEQQVRERVDPALLEQVGPGQYRLRVFPIPISGWQAGNILFDSNENRRPRPELMSLHMQYVVPRAHDGFALPVLSEKRNIDWTGKTKRRLNGEIVKANNWMPASHVPAKETGPLTLAVDLGDTTVSLGELQTKDIKIPSGRYRLIADTSYSMKTHRDAFVEAFKTLDGWAAANDKFSYSANVEINNVSFGGSASYQALLNGDPAKTSNYTGVILLTDKGRYAQTKETITKPLKTPLWIWHLGPAPSAMDDEVLDMVYRSGGGVVGTARDLQLGLSGSGRRITHGRIWTVLDSIGRRAVALKSEPLSNAAVRSLAARQIILQGSFGAKPDLETLDEFHRLAKTYNVVSPYSSMIVLVNERQKDALKKASQDDDRFEREGRSGEEQLSTPISPMVSAVPEPHEWLLIFVGLILLIELYRRRDRIGGFA